MHRIAYSALFVLCFASVLSAQDKASFVRLVTATKVPSDLKVHKLVRNDATNLGSLTVYEAASNIVVAAGQAFTFTSQQDWTGADHISVAIECPTSTSLQNTGIVVAWTVPLANAPNYTITDVIVGSTFLLQNMGGGVVPSYGTLLQISVVNNGKTNIACDQLTISAVVH
jgi:hypothetical protein